MLQLKNTAGVTKKFRWNFTLEIPFFPQNCSVEAVQLGRYTIGLNKRLAKYFI